MTEGQRARGWAHTKDFGQCSLGCFAVLVCQPEGDGFDALVEGSGTSPATGAAQGMFLLSWLVPVLDPLPDDVHSS